MTKTILNLTQYISRTVSRERPDQSCTSPSQLPKSKMVRSEYKKGTASDEYIHAPENKTAADNPSCRNNDPAHDNPRIRQRSNSTKSEDGERGREENRIIPWTIYCISQTPRALSVIRGRSSITLGEPVNRAKPPSDAVSQHGIISNDKRVEMLKKTHRYSNNCLIFRSNHSRDFTT